MLPRGRHTSNSKTKLLLSGASLGFHAAMADIGKARFCVQKNSPAMIASAAIRAARNNETLAWYLAKRQAALLASWQGTARETLSRSSRRLLSLQNWVVTAQCSAPHSSGHFPSVNPVRWHCPAQQGFRWQLTLPQHLKMLSACHSSQSYNWQHTSGRAVQTHTGSTLRQAPQSMGAAAARQARLRAQVQAANRHSGEQGMYLVAFVVAMVGLTYASVPLYRMFCQATGFGGTVQQGKTGM